MLRGCREQTPSENNVQVVGLPEGAEGAPLWRISLNKSCTLPRFPQPLSWNARTGCRLGLDWREHLHGHFWLNSSISGIGILSLLLGRIPSSSMRIPPFTCSLISLQRFNIVGALLWTSVNASGSGGVHTVYCIQANCELCIKALLHFLLPHRMLPTGWTPSHASMAVPG